MQAAYFMMMDWIAWEASFETKYKLDPKITQEFVDFGTTILSSEHDKYLGGAPAEFLPQMLLEENPVRSFPSCLHCIDFGRTHLKQ